MNTKSPSSQKRTQDLNLKIFQIRQKARLCVFMVTFTHILARLGFLLWDSTLNPKTKKIVGISLAFLVPMVGFIALESIFFKIKALVVAKYSKFVDIILLLCFTGDWIIALVFNLANIEQTDPPSIPISHILGFIAFSWRALFVTLLVQQWQLKIIAPVAAILITAIYTIPDCPRNSGWLIFRTIVQIMTLVMIIYCEDKTKWKLMRTNIEQEKWMQVNNFILDNIPENIMILDHGGTEEAKYMSDYCKAFFGRYNFLLTNAKEFFKSVQDLQQQHEQYEPETSSIALNVSQNERLATCHGLVLDCNEHLDQVETLEDLVVNFKSLILQRKLQEKQFLMYNGKLKIPMGNNQQHLDKSVEVKISFVHHFDNDYIILIFRDTTQRDLLKALEETNKYKDELLASVSHELRAPLNGNINLVEGAVASPTIPKDMKENLLIPALRSSKFLLHLINDILDMSQIKEKKLRLVFQTEDLRETLKSAAQLVELQAKRKGIEFILELDPRLPKKFCTDHLRVSQIVLNLLTNAMKFTSEGLIKFIAKPIKEDGSWIKINVEDSGVGMSRENLNKLFPNCTSIDCEGRQDMNPNGTGLGLKIASSLVQLLASEGYRSLSVASIPNQGSRFTFILESKAIQRQGLQDLEDSCSFSNEIADEPIGSLQSIVFSKPQSTLVSSSPGFEAQEIKSQSEGCSCPKILIVDDNPFNTMALETVLGSLHIKCESVYSGSSCIEKLQNGQAKKCRSGTNCKRYSVVFMDQEMPEMNGIETVSEIKRLQNEGLVGSMKIIGCTAHKEKEDVDKFLASGLDQCIFKPVSIVMIRNILKEV